MPTHFITAAMREFKETPSLAGLFVLFVLSVHSPGTSS
jgi:hypothetical protein